MKIFKSFPLVTIPGLCVLLILSCSKPTKEYKTWAVYNGTKEGMKYSSLTQIDTSNVDRLQVAWTYHTGDADTVHGSQIQCNPIMIDGILYGVGPQMKLFAFDVWTKKEKWVFDANEKTEFDANRVSYHTMINSRGVAYWTDGKGDNRIFFTAGSNTYAINATTGKPVTTFGKNGFIDLHDDLGRDVKDLFVVNTSPGLIYKDLIILGTRVDEELPAAPGHIRAYDVRTGKLIWIFHTVPQPGEYGYETWEDKAAWKYIGAANTWSGFSLDETRGILYAPTGSAAYDFYGGNRKGSNLFANCLLALDASTGKHIWHFQFMHHDVWDKDLPTPPALLTLTRKGKQIDAVAQTTKNGMVYVFDRETGKPLFDIDEIPVDTVSDLVGEKLWPTQPIPQKPAPFVRQSLTENDINPYLSDSVQSQLKRDIRSYRHGNMFLPPGTTPSLVFPGYDGGGEWGGPAVDPQTGILYVNANEMAWIMKMNENKIEQPKKESWLQAGERLYKQNCMACHNADRKGTGNNPTLINIKSKYKQDEFIGLINSGRRMMPAFKKLSAEDKNAIASYILEIKADQKKETEAAKKPVIVAKNNATANLVSEKPVLKPAKADAKTKVKTKKTEKKSEDDLESDLIGDDEFGESEIAEYEEDLKAVEDDEDDAGLELSEDEEDLDKKDEEIYLTDSDGRRLCKVRDCDQVSTVDMYCRFHYLLLWKKIQIRKHILNDSKLEKYLENLTSRYPDKFLEVIKKDLKTEKDFLSVIQEMELDENALVETENEDEVQSFSDEIRGIGDAPSMDEDGDF